jgi:hypothetical protein
VELIPWRRHRVPDERIARVVAILKHSAVR